MMDSNYAELYFEHIYGEEGTKPVSKEDITKILNDVLSKEKIISVTEKENKNYESFRGCIITSEDLSIKCRATIEEKIAEIKEQYSEELALSLFGGRMPE